MQKLMIQDLKTFFSVYDGFFSNSDCTFFLYVLLKVTSSSVKI